jgi:uncharacterized membrane protein YbhN (UPF0104 family)
MRPGLRKSLYYAGGALAVLGVGFVGQRIGLYGGEAGLARLDARSSWTLAGLAVIYGIANLMLGLSWWHLLGHFGVAARPRWALWTFGMSQLAKYVPGNIFHLASRQAIGMASSIAAWPLVKSLTWELGLLSLSGALFGLLALPLHVHAFPLAAAVPVFVATVLAVALALRFSVGARCALAFLWQTGFLAVMGVLFIALAELVAPNLEGAFPWFCLGGAYVAAWLAGLFTPGAPAGIGVRELALLLILDPLGHQAGLVLAVLLMRLVTVGGDVVLFLFSFSISVFSRSHDAS